MAENYTSEELNEALKSIGSMLGKSEKAEPKLKANTSQHVTIMDAIKAYKIAIELVTRELAKNIKDNVFASEYTKEELKKAYQAISLSNSKVEKIICKFDAGTSQYTLAIRRIRAFKIAMALIDQELS